MTTRGVLRLTSPPVGYEQRFEVQRNREIEDADSLSVKRPELRLRVVDTYKSDQRLGLKNDWVLGDAVDGAIIFTVPPVGPEHVQYDIKKIDSSSNTVTIKTSGSDQIEFGSSIVLLTQGDAVRVAQDGKAYYIL